MSVVRSGVVVKRLGAKCMVTGEDIIISEMAGERSGRGTKMI